MARVSHRHSEVAVAWRAPSTAWRKSTGAEAALQGSTKATRATSSHIICLGQIGGGFASPAFLLTPERRWVCVAGEEKGREGCFPSDITGAE